MCGCTTKPQTNAVYAPKAPTDVSPLERKLGDNPDDMRVNLALGDRALAVGDYLRAEQYFRRAQALGAPDKEIVPRILKALVMARRYDEALALCHDRLESEPQDRATRMVEAALYEALERPKDAERELDVLVSTRPEDPHPYLALGKLYRDSYHDDARARRMFEKYLSLAPKSHEAEAIRYQLEEQRQQQLPSLPEQAQPTPEQSTPSNQPQAAPQSLTAPQSQNQPPPDPMVQSHNKNVQPHNKQQEPQP